MKKRRYIRILFILFVLVASLAVVSENYMLGGGVKSFDIKRFSKTLHNKEKIIQDIIDKTETIISESENPGRDDFFIQLDQFNQLFSDNDIGLFIASDTANVYWSDNVFTFTDEIKGLDDGLAKLPNGWYVLNKEQYKGFSIWGIVLVKYQYKVQNEFLKNRFAKNFRMPSDYQVHPEPSSGFYSINNDNGQYIFSINPSGFMPCIYTDLYLPVFLYLLAFIVFLMLFYHLSIYRFYRHKGLKIFLIFILLGLIYVVMRHFGLPKSLYHLHLFSPKYFAYSWGWSSIGEMLFSSIIFFYFSLIFARLYSVPVFFEKNKALRAVHLISGITLLAVLFVLLRQIMYILVMNSGVSYSIYNISSISPYSFPGFLSIGFFYLGFFFIAFRFVQVLRKNIKPIYFFGVLTIVTILIAGLLVYFNANSLRLNLVFWLILAVVFYTGRKSILNHWLAVIVLFVVIFTGFSLLILLRFVDKHEQHIQELMAINLSAEHDPTAELFLRDIDTEIQNDTLLNTLLEAPFDNASDYIASKYFGGYFRDYELQQTYCYHADSLLIQPDNKLMPCDGFFAQLIENYGVEIPGTNLYFFDNMNGRITYFGKYSFLSQSTNSEVSVYLELNSKLLSEGAGFPELLLPSQSADSRLRNNFSFAKYNQGELVDRGGSFLYAYSPNVYNLPDKNLHFFEYNNYKHCMYRVGANSSIIVSRPHIDIYDYLISFPYIFVFLFVFSIAGLFLFRPNIRSSGVNNSLRKRIQYSVIGVLFISLLIVGSGTIFYYVNQYRSNYRNDLIDKINSVSAEIDMVLNNTQNIDQGILEVLNYELLKISEIFWIDINIFGTDGSLLASSRPEVFEKGLMSEQMNSVAYKNLALWQSSRFLNSEKIANMEFLSAYVPMMNIQNEIIGFINIPYFTKEREFRKQITTFIVAFISIYVFLLMASILVVFYVSSRITNPLRLIRENLRQMQLGKVSKPIDYAYDDEIGLLVTEYNNKVDELALRAAQLARSEREMAWREMAKQIAHEIKNPLTPMKLNIQFLQRTSVENPNEYKEKIKRITDTIIEQIDNLSAIAAEFSNFAKMPKAKNQVFDLMTKLNETIQLYNYSGQVDIDIKQGCDQTLWVMADPEQFSRAIINIVRNAIQAIPDTVRGKIEIVVQSENQWAIIQIKDNGKGMPEDLKEKIFVPNFTTKSSGTGLGLAITRNIIESFNGNIWFVSEPDKGTTFFIKIPLHNYE